MVTCLHSGPPPPHTHTHTHTNTKILLCLKSTIKLCVKPITIEKYGDRAEYGSLFKQT